jgi:hypothetical protein
MQRLAEACRGELDLGQVDLRALCDQASDPPSRRPLVPLRVIAVQETEGQCVGESDVPEVARGRLSDPRVPVASAWRKRAYGCPCATS